MLHVEASKPSLHVDFTAFSIDVDILERSLFVDSVHSVYIDFLTPCQWVDSSVYM